MFHFEEGYTYNMPPHFGGVEGDGLQNLRYDDVSSIAISYLTDEGCLSQYVPDAFEILEPVVSVSYQKCRGVQWMAGGQYSLIAVMTPARHIPTGTDGSYVLIIWENKTAPILGGREQTGMPKVFADIPDYHQLGRLITASASHEGRVFLELELELDKDLTPEQLSEMSQNSRVNQFGWRYIPRIGSPGAALSHATLYPAEATCHSGSTGSGRLVWTQADPLYNPIMAPIVNALVDLPILEYRDCRFTKGVANLRQDLARDLG
jgi:acetoacetate decarboxylase